MALTPAIWNFWERIIRGDLAVAFGLKKGQSWWRTVAKHVRIAQSVPKTNIHTCIFTSAFGVEAFGGSFESWVTTGLDGRLCDGILGTYL
jgi:hypothetical protein